MVGRLHEALHLLLQAKIGEVCECKVFQGISGPLSAERPAVTPASIKGLGASDGPAVGAHRARKEIVGTVSCDLACILARCV